MCRLRHWDRPDFHPASVAETALVLPGVKFVAVDVSRLSGMKHQFQGGF